MVAQHYRWDFYGLSTDSKPDATNPKVANGSTYYEADTSKLYVWYNDQWYEKEAGGSGELPIASADTLGGVKVGEGLSITEAGVLSASGGGGGAVVELTSADYDYPEENPTSVDFSALPEGLYYTSTTVNIHLDTGEDEFHPETFVIKLGSAGTTKFIKSDPYDERLFYYPDGYSNRIIIDNSMIANNLTTNSSLKALSARQGIVLKQMINYDLGNNGNDYPAANPDGLKLWDLDDGNYYLNMPRKIYLDSDVNNGIDGFQGWIKVMRMSDGSSVDPEFTYIKIYGVMGDTTPFEVHQTTRRSNGVKISCQLVDTTDS